MAASFSEYKCDGCARPTCSGKAVIDVDVRTFNPSQFLKRCLECRQPRNDLRIVFGISEKHSDPPHSSALLGARG